MVIFGLATRFTYHKGESRLPHPGGFRLFCDGCGEGCGTLKNKINDKYCAEQYRQGRTTQDIADELGVSNMTINRHLRAQGVELRKQGPRKKPAAEKKPKARKLRKPRTETPKRRANQKYCPCLFLCLAMSGMSYYEIERITGANHSNVSTHLRKLGYFRGKGNGPKRAEQDAAKREEGQRHFAEKFAKRYGDCFEYLSGYTSTRDGAHPLLRCKTCGHEFERFIDWRFEIRCPECYKQEVEANREAKAAEIKRSTIYFKRCEECGEVFITESQAAKFCSKRCRQKVKSRKTHARRRANGRKRNRDTSHRRRARKYGVAYDPTITLDWLIERDNNTCHICGGECDRSDLSYGTAGPKYPSADCVIPMKKGGGFTKDNVKLAHHLCNSKKRDLDEW